ncbi:DUF433 domain-containing protein [Halalkaliarchaeum sp. AArc-GB]|uniref:DUF433 domain-containing protein n=1 Tax=Halalkaliarchaeum sp. AArc-GB TaxID=3074078 RepID=UPI0028579AB6|nr:DUF433 domain-containing protein [Halalkaliarchaeum sp. AArc-GB]MDR5673416.1 DUF433 domain-containing protein [Halalkaliarchaeum sp. AArc-GB]
MEGIVRTDDVLGGEPRLDGRRISVRQIVELVADVGMSPAEMAAVRDRHRNAMDRVAEGAIDPPETVSP